MQTRRLGLGHAIYRALEGAGLESGPGLAVLGDTIVQADFAGLMAAPGHGMGVRSVDDPRRFGVAVVEGGRIVDLEEKPEQPRSDLALVGLYHFRDVAPLRASLEGIIERDQRTRGEYQLTDALQRMIQSGEELSPFPIEGWFDVGKEETWLETNRALLAGCREPAARDGVRFHPPVLVPDSAELADCEIGPYVSLGEGVRISGGRIANSVVGNEAVLTDCRLEDSLIGARSTLAGLSGHANIGEDCSAAQGADHFKR
jgi:glucose-1-phosphate thymidylyltransferase